MKKDRPVQIVAWDKKYSTGIEKIDSQHRHLFDLTNQLYNACFSNEDELDAKFKEAIKKMVDYVRYHFESEQKLLAAIGYPEYQNHKSQHDKLIQDILIAVQDYKDGKKHTPNNFVRTLKEWILSHIAYYDKAYSTFAIDQLKKGLLTEKTLREGLS